MISCWCLFFRGLLYVPEMAGLPSLKLTAKAPENVRWFSGWKMIFFGGPGLFSAAFAVSFRECKEDI